MRVVDHQPAVRAEGLIELSVRIVLLPEQVHAPVVVVFIGKVPAKRAVHRVLAHHAQHSQQNDEKDQSTHARAPAVGIALLQPPLSQKRQAEADQQQRPPAHIPLPEVVAADGAGLDQQRHHADNDQHNRAHNRGPPQAAIVRTLRAPLILRGAALRLPLPARIRTARPRGPGSEWRRCGSHQRPPSVRSISLGGAGTIPVPGAAGGVCHPVGAGCGG